VKAITEDSHFVLHAIWVQLAILWMKNAHLMCRWLIAAIAGGGGGSYGDSGSRYQPYGRY